METDSAPDVPDDLPQYVVDALNRQDPRTLRVIAKHAEELASWKDAHAEDTPEEDDAVREETTEDSDRPKGVPGKASIVVKNINDNRYYYYQWRDGDKVKSKYKGPVDSGE
ncbi:hypothetical protein HUG10_19965 (plasmid) [Halorarum halophilum]|uniref:DUF6788 domain-containing protein n=1 Tax=Halorarum halophilum TaxID=2743090 RepID=A0A7D5GHF1_9EURY|nr:hypothetical protein [Halobaculum halophilum]QLG29888.1 hypothetical protein HUG10_19965 [Halobaculum halophilum]